MKHLLLTTIVAVVLVGCGPSASDISIWKAAADGNIEAVKQHLAAGTDVNEANVNGRGTPLHFAAAFGHKEIVELLIANGADVHFTNPFNLTALDQASMLDFTETIDLLCKHGAKTDAELKAAGK